MHYLLRSPHAIEHATCLWWRKRSLSIYKHIIFSAMRFGSNLNQMQRHSFAGACAIFLLFLLWGFKLKPSFDLLDSAKSSTLRCWNDVKSWNSLLWRRPWHPRLQKDHRCWKLALWKGQSWGIVYSEFMLLVSWNVHNKCDHRNFPLSWFLLWKFCIECLFKFHFYCWKCLK